MRKVNIREAKARLSHLLKQVQRGERVVLCRRNVPIAEIIPLRPRGTRARRIGRAKGQFELTPAFFKPLPEDTLRRFDGTTS